MEAASSVAAGAPKAGWWVRFFAYLVDNLIVGIPAFIVGFIVAAMAGGIVSATGEPGPGIGFFYLIIILASAGYFVYFWTQQDGQTPMNKALNIKVVRAEGGPITIGTGIIRYVGYLVNDIIFGLPIGFIWAAFDGNQQGWHDKLAGTYVVKTA
jgi:uncharacterized RDD family membrane protein YckC